MRAKPYPLDALSRVRSERLGECQSALAAAIAAREEAERGHARLLAQREAARREVSAIREREARSLGGGALSASDLQRGSAWEARVTWEDDERTCAVAESADRVVAAKRAETKAREEVAAAEAAFRSVDEHRARWQGERARAEEAAAEEEASEAWRPR